MIGLDSLAKIDSRLRQAFPANNDLFFGGVSIILCGDFGQLPPVGDTPLFRSLRRSKNERILQGRTAYYMFDKTITLKQVMRQQGESEQQVQFRALLGRLRDYACTKDDYILLSSRVQQKLSVEEVAKFQNSVRLYATKKKVLAHNKMRLVQNGLPVKRLVALHPRGGRSACSASTDQAGGLSKVIFVSKGCKIMLTKNIWIKHGLVNGTMGVIDDIIWKENQNIEDLPVIIMVAIPTYTGPTSWYDNNNVPLIPLVTSTQEWEIQKPGDQTPEIHSRKQFPFIVSYAMTIHKSQGMTMEEEVLDLGEDDFAPGLCFVGISRVKTLTGLMIDAPFSFHMISSAQEKDIVKERKQDEIRRRLLMGDSS
jgi:ATP-dependent exoDNAse (exonuclease V) alpha subunit